MPLAPQDFALVGLAALGALLGWWPLAAWVGRTRLDPARPGCGVRTAAASTTAGAFGALGWRFGTTAAAEGAEADASSLVVLGAFLVFAAAGTVLGIVDVIEHRLPNAVLGPAGLAVAGLLGVAAALDGAGARPGRALTALVGAAVLFALFLAVALLSPRAMGMGDVKLAALVGGVIGWGGLTSWVVGVVAMFLVGGLVAVVGLALRRVTAGGAIPFGPAMLAGALLAIVAVPASLGP
ncbi:A24 family peptidase [Agromyces mediolanus]|uniref:prepilin peptidase n=1 Tax=Agromyces mediolanus TaxID=41986 RepID=UPI00203FF2EF|nr:A24 family peptidase [Agromyces mediolanus]MCM3657762.1 A24 family peptidase [Agromyces mediolanus]